MHDNILSQIGWGEENEKGVIFCGRPEEPKCLAINSKKVLPPFSGFTISNISGYVWILSIIGC